MNLSKRPARSPRADFGNTGVDCASRIDFGNSRGFEAGYDLAGHLKSAKLTRGAARVDLYGNMDGVDEDGKTVFSKLFTAAHGIMGFADEAREMRREADEWASAPDGGTHCPMNCQTWHDGDTTGLIKGEEADPDETELWK